MFPNPIHSSSGGLPFKGSSCSLITIAFMMIAQIEFAFAIATNASGGIVPASFAMNSSALMNNAYVANQPSTEFRPFRDLNTSPISKNIHNDLATAENEEGVDYLANNFGVPKEYSVKDLKNIKGAEGKEYPDSPFAKFAEMEISENEEQHGKHEGEHIKEHDEHYDVEGDEGEEFGAHHQNGLSANDEDTEMNNHDIMESVRGGENIPSKIGELHNSVGLKDAKSKMPNKQGNAPQRIRLSRAWGRGAKRGIGKIFKEKGFYKRRRTLFRTLGVGNKKKKKNDEFRRR